MAYLLQSCGRLNWLALIVACLLSGIAFAAEPERDGCWLVVHSDKGASKTMEMTITPKAAPVPALKHRLIASEFDLINENAAIYYLKAMGFIEQNPARDAVSKFLKENAEEARKTEKADYPPYSWLSLPPAEMPQQQVRDYLKLTEFQRPYLVEAARRRKFDLDRRIRGQKDPIIYLLPEIQTMRELARTQSLRCRLAISENRLDDALEIIGQQFAAARHLGDDEFLISNLVGIAIGAVNWEDLLQFVQHPDAPNLYWALAALPDPLVSMKKSNSYERQFLFEQVKVLREVTEEPVAAEYWSDFIDRFLVETEALNGQGGSSDRFCQAWNISGNPEIRRLAVVVFIVEAYPGARRYLLEAQNMAPEKVDRYASAQAVFLALKLMYEESRDELLKWVSLPAEQWEVNRQRGEAGGLFSKLMTRYGPVAEAAIQFLPAASQGREAQLRCQQKIRLAQTVEAIRMYGSGHEGNLPDSLEELPAPAPLEPFSGKPFQYERTAEGALLTGMWRTGIQFRLALKMAPGTTAGEPAGN